MKKVGLVSHFYVHYRIPVLKSLATSEKISYSFLGDTRQSDDIKRVDFDKESLLKEKFIPIKNLSIGHYLFWQKGLFKQIRKQNFDAVIFLGDIRFLSTWLALLVLRINGKKTFLWTHGLYGRESWLHLQIKLLFLRLSDGAFLYNNRAKQLYRQHGITESKLTPIYNSLNFEETEYYRTNYNEPVREQILTSFRNPYLPVVFCIGRLNKTKNISLLIEAIALLKSNNNFVNCFIIGDGEDKNDLQALVMQRNIKEQVYFTGALFEETQISRYIMSSELCVCPGAVGLTAIHSLSYGVPVITNNNFTNQGPEYEAITPGKTGDFYKEGNVHDLSKKILECIDQRLKNKEESIKNCIAVIQQYYNPEYQKETINNCILAALKDE